MGLPTDHLSPGEQVVLEMHEHVKHPFGTMLICLPAPVGLMVVPAGILDPTGRGRVSGSGHESS